MSDLFEDRELASNVLRYEAMKKNGVFSYFDVDEYLSIVNFYIDNNQIKKAHEACAAGLNIHPGSSELKLKQAQLLVAMGNPVEGISWLENVKELQNGNHEYYLTLGMAKSLLNQAEEAVENFDAAIKFCPVEDLEEVIYSIGEALENNEDFNSALKYYREGTKFFPENEDFLFRMAYSYDKLADYDQCILYYQKYLDLNPFSENAWYNVGIIYNKVEEFDKAVEAYDYALALDNDHYDALFNKANSLANLNKFNEAIQCYQDYLKEYEENLSAWYYIGECYLQLKEYDQAIGYFKKILNVQPDFTDAYYGMGLVYDELKNYNESIAMLKKAVELDAEHVDAWFTLGGEYMNITLWEQAVEAFIQTISLNRFDFEAWISLAEAYHRLNKMDEVINSLSEALEYIPDNADLMFAYSAYLFLNKSMTEGMKWLEKAFAINPKGYELVLKIYPDADKYEPVHKLVHSK